MDRATLQSLRDHHLAFFRRWLAAENGGARDAWLAHGVAAIARWRGLPIERLVRREDLDGVVAVVLGEAVAEGMARPLARAVISEIGEPVATLEATTAEMMGERARAAIEALVARPDVIDAAMVRAVTREPAVEAVMRDVLFEALVAFNDRTNPFVAPWGVPALLDALPRVGRGTIKKTFDTVRGEFERRLQPEMRRFLEGFSRKSLDTMVDLFEAKAAEPELVALRHHAVGKVLDAPIAELAWPPGDPRHASLAAAVEAGIAHVLAEPRTRALTEAVVSGWWARHAKTTLDELLAELEIVPVHPEPFVTAAWPAVQAALDDDAVVSLLAELIDASHEEWLASS